MGSCWTTKDDERSEDPIPRETSNTQQDDEIVDWNQHSPARLASLGEDLPYADQRNDADDDEDEEEGGEESHDGSSDAGGDGRIISGSLGEDGVEGMRCGNTPTLGRGRPPASFQSALVAYFSHSRAPRLNS